MLHNFNHDIVRLKQKGYLNFPGPTERMMSPVFKGGKEALLEGRLQAVMLVQVVLLVSVVLLLMVVVLEKAETR